MNDSIRLNDPLYKSATLASHPDCCDTFFSDPAGLVIVKITKDGRLEKGPGLSDDAASLLFFDACQKVFSNAADELRDLRAEVVRLQSARYKYEDDPEMVFDEGLGWVHVIVQKEFRDLRAEVEKLRTELAHQKVENNHNWMFQEISEEALKRAETAEACLAASREESERMRQEAIHFRNKAEELQAQCAEREIELSRHLENEFAVKLAAERADKIKWAKALLVSMESLADDNPDHWASDESRKRYVALTIAAVREEIGLLEAAP